jgi:hypothetical protein
MKPRELRERELTPYDFWRRTHALHHANSGNLDRRGIADVDTLTVHEYLSQSRWGGFDISVKGSLSSPCRRGCSETRTAARIPLGERLEKCFGILFGCTRMPRLDGAIAAENYRYVRKAEPGRGIDRRLGASRHPCMWGLTDRNGRRFSSARHSGAM